MTAGIEERDLGAFSAFAEAVRKFHDTREGRRLAALPNTSIQTFVCERCRRSHITVTLHRTEILATFCRREECFQNAYGLM